MIWEGETITGPILIYHDEITTDTTTPTDDNSNDSGDLVCRSENVGRTFWRDPRGSTQGSFNTIRTPSTDPVQNHPFLARLVSVDSVLASDSHYRTNRPKATIVFSSSSIVPLLSSSYSTPSLKMSLISSS